MKVLQVVEEYDHALSQTAVPTWLHHTKKCATVHPHLLLQGDAVHYAANAHPPASPSLAARELSALTEIGVAIYLVIDDARERGLAPDALASHVRLVARADVPALYAAHDQIWLW